MTADPRQTVSDITEITAETSTAHLASLIAVVCLFAVTRVSLRKRNAEARCTPSADQPTNPIHDLIY